MSQPTVVEMLARGYTRGQIAEWQAAVAAAPAEPEPKRAATGRSRRKA